MLLLLLIGCAQEPDTGVTGDTSPAGSCDDGGNGYSHAIAAAACESIYEDGCADWSISQNCAEIEGIIGNTDKCAYCAD